MNRRNYISKTIIANASRRPVDVAKLRLEMEHHHRRMRIVLAVGAVLAFAVGFWLLGGVE